MPVSRCSWLDRSRAGLFIAADDMMNVQQAAVSHRRLVHGLGSVGKLEVGRHRSIARQVKSIGLGAIGEFCVDAREAVDAQLTAKERAHLINVGALLDRIM